MSLTNIKEILKESPLCRGRPPLSYVLYTHPIYRPANQFPGHHLLLVRVLICNTVSRPFRVTAPITARRQQKATPTGCPGHQGQRTTRTIDPPPTYYMTKYTGPEFSMMEI